MTIYPQVLDRGDEDSVVGRSYRVWKRRRVAVHLSPEELVQRTLSALDREFGAALSDIRSFDFLLADPLFRQSANGLHKKILVYLAEKPSKRTNPPEGYIWNVLPSLAKENVQEFLDLMAELRNYFIAKKKACVPVSSVSNGALRLWVGPLSLRSLVPTDVVGTEGDDDVEGKEGFAEAMDLDEADAEGSSAFDLILLWFTAEDRKHAVLKRPVQDFLFQDWVRQILEGQELEEMNLGDLIGLLLDSDLPDGQKRNRLESLQALLQNGNLEVTSPSSALEPIRNGAREAVFAACSHVDGM